MTDKQNIKEILTVLDNVKDRIRERDDKIHDVLENLDEDDEYAVDYLLGKTSGYLHSAVEINKMKKELKKELED